MRRLLLARGEVDEELDDEAAIEHQHLDEVIGLMAPTSSAAYMVRASLSRAATRDVGMSRGVLVAAGDEAVVVSHLDPGAGGKPTLCVRGLEQPDGNDPCRVGVRLVAADVLGDAGHAVGVHHDPVLLRRRRRCCVMRRASHSMAAARFFSEAEASDRGQPTSLTAKITEC
jgi:hypothetical protein